MAANRADEVHRNLVQAKLDEVAESADFYFARARQECKSPIEEIMLAILLRLDIRERETMFFAIGDDDGLEEALSVRPGTALSAIQRDMFSHHPVIACAQAPVERYCADFMLWMSFCEQPAHVMCIECDGHDYHERTKQQAAHDRARDRKMTVAGIEVMRFTGSEIYNKPEDILDQLRNHLLRVSSKQEAAAIAAGLSK